MSEEMSNKIHRHEIFSSPEVSGSNKQQRINTDQKAPKMMKSSSSPFQQATAGAATAASSSSSTSSCSSRMIQELSHSIVSYIQSKNIHLSKKNEHQDIRTIFTICPIGTSSHSHTDLSSPAPMMTLNPSYDHSLFQMIQPYNPKYCQPDRHSFSHPLLFYNIAWYLCCCHASPPLQETLNQLFHQFVTHHSLDSDNPVDNQISSLTQIELATFLLFLSWNDHAVSYLNERKALEVIINGILSSLHTSAKKPHRVSSLPLLLTSH